MQALYLSLGGHERYKAYQTRGFMVQEVMLKYTPLPLMLTLGQCDYGDDKKGVIILQKPFAE